MNNKTIDKTIAAYLAGIADGEGCICISKNAGENNNYNYRISFAVAMNDLDSLKVFQKYFGGNINIGHRRQKSGRISHNSFVIKYASEKTKLILLKLLPYLRVKREQAKTALEFIKLKEKYIQQRENSNKYFSKTPNNLQKKYENLYLRCKSLKKHGWTVSHAD